MTRALWLIALAALVPWAIRSAAQDRSSFAENLTLGAWWPAAGIVLIALIACGPVGLTIARMATPIAIPVATLTLFFGADLLPGIVALAGALLATLSAFMAETGEACVQVSAYGDERRLPLRVPAAMQVPIVVAWLLWVSTAVVGVLLLAAHRMVIGVAMLAIAALLTWFVYPRMHRFSLRWLVTVPAGVVVHDPVLLGETLMVLRPNVSHAQLALAGTEAADLSGPAAGHAVEITLHEMVQVVLAATPAKPKGTAIHAQSILIAPSRPGRALRALADRKVNVI